MAFQHFSVKNASITYELAMLLVILIIKKLREHKGIKFINVTNNFDI
jgi:hypothetical protein